MGLLHFLIGTITILMNIFYLSTVNNTINVIIQQVALVSISKVAIFYSSSLAKKTSPVKKMPEGVQEGGKFRRFLEVTNYRRNRGNVDVGE